MKTSTLAIPVKVLLVDDECQQLALRTTIFKLAGFSVLSASDPLEALSIAGDADHIDIAILDYEMPVMNGGALARCLKTRLPGVHIVLHSAALAIDSDDLNYFDSLIPKGEGTCVLLHHVTKVSVELTAARSRCLHGGANYTNACNATEVDFRRFPSVLAAANTL